MSAANAASNEIKESVVETILNDRKLIDKNMMEKIDLTSKPCQPHPHDVLFGRGKHVNDHMGNVYFRQLVLFEKSIYKQTITCAGRRHVARHVINQIRRLDPPGRFLVPDENTKATKWFMAKDHRALMKTSQALRELNHKPLVHNVYPNDIVVISNKLCLNPDSDYTRRIMGEKCKHRNKIERKSMRDIEHGSSLPGENHFYTSEKQGKEACIDVELSISPKDDTRDLDREDNSNQGNMGGSINQINEHNSNPLSLLSYICDFSSEKATKGIVPSIQPIEANHLDFLPDESQHMLEQLSTAQYSAANQVIIKNTKKTDENAQRFADTVEIKQLAKNALICTSEHVDGSISLKSQDKDDQAKVVNPSNQSTVLAKDLKTNIAIINNHIVRNSNCKEMEISPAQEEIQETLEQVSKAEDSIVKKNISRNQDDSGLTNNQNFMQFSNHGKLGEEAIAILMKAIQDKWSKAKLSEALTHVMGNRVAMEKSDVEDIHAPVPDVNAFLTKNEPEEHQSVLLSSSKLNSMKIESDSLLQNPQLASNCYLSLVPHYQNESRNDLNSVHFKNDILIPETCISTGKATNGSSPEIFNHVEVEQRNGLLLDDMMIEDANKTHSIPINTTNSGKVEHNTSAADNHHIEVANKNVTYPMELDSNNECLDSKVSPVPVSIISCHIDTEDKRKVQGQQKSQENKKNGHKKFILPLSYIGQSFANQRLHGTLDLTPESKVVFEELVDLKHKGEGAELHLPSVVGSLCQRIIDLEELLL